MTYRRPPDRCTHFKSVVLSEHREGVVISHLIQPKQPLIVNNTVLYDKNFFSVWYCPYTRWHDIGAFYDPSYTFTGYYCDLCTPVKKVANGFESTDLFLDLWIYPDHKYLILDQNEFNNALSRGWMTYEQISSVKAELSRLIEEVQSHSYPTIQIKQLLQLPKNIQQIVKMTS